MVRQAHHEDQPVENTSKNANFSALRMAPPYVARGVFGAPTFFVNGELHFGQDRLDFVSFVPRVMENGARRAPFGKRFVRRAGL